jgi:hydroxymethylpyrimidine/phosphomethylpyrimidine kinase
MCALGVYGMSAVTAQNIRGVYGVREMEPDMVDAVKMGMVSSAGIIRTVRDRLFPVAGGRDGGYARVDGGC